MSAARRIRFTGQHETGGNYIEFIERAAHNMDRLVRDLLDVSVMESGSFAVTPRPVDLWLVLAEARQRFELAATERRVTFEFEVALMQGSSAAIFTACPR
jgi:signal transduction histidine kinase